MAMTPHRTAHFELVHSADDNPPEACDSLGDVVKKAARGLVTPQHSRGLARDTGRVAAEYVQDASPKSPARLGSAADVTKARLPVTGSELAAMKTRIGNRLNSLSRGIVRQAPCRLIAAAVIGSLSVPTIANPNAEGTALISFLDKEYKPGLLKIGNRGRHPNGNYIWGANFPDELRVPAQKLEGLCRKQDGIWSLLIPAVSLKAYPGSVTVRFGDQEFPITREDVWGWARGEPISNKPVEFAYGRGFDAVFDRRLVSARTRGIGEANANPPLGLFGCSEVNGGLKWAATIMPGEYGGNTWLFLKIRPVTYEFLADIRRKRQQIQLEVLQSRQAMKAKNAASDRQAAAENARLEPWRQKLKVGDQTSCGMIVDVRGPLVEVQLSQYADRPDESRRVWLKRSQLSDRYGEVSCRAEG